MNPRKPSFARALLLLIVALGPLQAQTVLACAMMDVVVQDDCCCEDHDLNHGCESPDCGAALETREAPCCERSVEISADPDARQDGPIFKPVEVRSDADPPQALVSSFQARFTPQAVPSTRGFHSAFAARRGGPETYLATQRLRI